MPYSSITDLLKEFSSADLARLTGDATGAEVNTDRVDYAISNADAFINAYLHDRYALPFGEPYDHIIIKLSVDLAVANLYEIAYQKTTLPSTVLWRRLNAIRLLKDIQQGNVSLQSAIHGTNAPPSILSNKSDSDRTFDTSLFDASLIDL